MSDEKTVDTRNVLERINAVMGEIGSIEKTGTNEKQGYGYVELREVKARMQPLLVRHGLICIPTHEVLTAESAPTKSGGKMQIVTISSRMEVRAFCPEPSSITATVLGCGSDTGDKAIYKAMSGAEKYLFGQLFCLPFGDDAEKDSHERAAAAAPQAMRPAAGSRAAARPAPRQAPKPAPRAAASQPQGIIGRANDNDPWLTVLVVDVPEPFSGISKKNGERYTIYKAECQDGTKLSTFDENVGGTFIVGATLEVQVGPPNKYHERLVSACELVSIVPSDARADDQGYIPSEPLDDEEE